MALDYSFDIFVSSNRETLEGVDSRRFLFDDGQSRPTRVIALFRDKATVEALKNASKDVRSIVRQAGFGMRQSPVAAMGGVQPENNEFIRMQVLNKLRMIRAQGNYRHSGDDDGFYLPHLAGSMAEITLPHVAQIDPAADFETAAQTVRNNEIALPPWGRPRVRSFPNQSPPSAEKAQQKQPQRFGSRVIAVSLSLMALLGSAFVLVRV